MNETVLWRGRSGIAYTYHVNNLDRPLRDAPGNYILVRREPTQWILLYIGQTESLEARLSSRHHQWPCARRQGLTHIHAHLSLDGKAVRLAEEMDLINHYHPVCNVRV